MNIPSSDHEALARVGDKVRQRLSADPAIIKVDTPKAEIYAAGGFLSDDECTRLIAMIDAAAIRSELFTQTRYSPDRTSYSANFDPHDSFVRMIERRFADFLGIDPAWAETIQGQRYEPGQEFKAHCDWFDTSAQYWPAEDKSGGQRCWTAMVYLNDVEAGGETEFPHIGASIAPQKGAIITWNNMDVDGTPNPDTLHAALPVVKGTKYVITKWFRTRVWQSHP